MDKFIFPDYYKWPFFFTIQKNADTRMKQLNMWASLIKDYCKANKLWKISKTQLLQNIGTNNEINRRLSQDNVDLIFNYMVSIAKCAIEITKEDFYILWKSLNEWEQVFYDSVNKHHRVDSLETLEYLMYDEEIRNEEFYEMDQNLLVRILKGLESKNKCILITDSDGRHIGVKFIKS